MQSPSPYASSSISIQFAGCPIHAHPLRMSGRRNSRTPSFGEKNATLGDVTCPHLPVREKCCRNGNILHALPYKALTVRCPEQAERKCAAKVESRRTPASLAPPCSASFHNQDRN